MPHSINRVILWGGLLALAAGCQRGPAWNLASVEGTVTQEGRPLSGIEVVFVPEGDTVGPRASGMTDEAGRYRLRTDGREGGASVGRHRVCLYDTHRASLKFPGSLPKEKKKESDKEAASVSARVPLSYSRFSETPLRAEVGREPLVFDIALP